MRTTALALALSLVSEGCVLDWDRFQGTGMGPDAATDGDSGSTDGAPLAISGDILFFDFNDGTATDRSGAGHNGKIIDANVVAGRYGSGMEFEGVSPGSYVEVPDSSGLFSAKAITVEAWVFRNGLGPHMIYGDWDDAETPSSEIMLVLFGDSTAFFSNDCNEEVRYDSFQSLVPAKTWTHVAVTWDEAALRFYLDGKLKEDFSSSHAPCEKEGTNYRVGLAPNYFHPMDGIIDELKVSSYAKSTAEIVESMMYDSSKQ